MPELRATTLVDAPLRTVAAALLDARLLARSIRGLGVRITAGPVLYVGAELAGSVGPVAGTLLVTRADTTGVSAELVGGPLPRFVLITDLLHTGGGTMVVDSVEWTSPGGPFGRLADVIVGRGLALKVLQARAEAVSARSRELVGAKVVVAAAIVRDGLLLAQRRGHPERLAGGWELPGGRVEPGEDDRAAVARECVEELGAEVVAGEQIGPDIPLRADHLLRVYRAELVAGEPRALDHPEVRWIGSDELDNLNWLAADRVVLPALHDLLDPPA
ncbi:NUDIX domain-containing protein [Actinosynnema sp. NPDC047251]|uniref:8-oxo-dGTP diphosphatase n=1 Tax=Saccharothrix espanaensis (strain ATCC 51144 / DSM 44229 / JCM 9112 / NBRC 15066 / NRRL 15764) TaxID=1179773 RepID=K0JTM7_SACES|nr:NUDIX domain-containing protein [Saccharothrix espanaensis]CCH28169.1 NUDIX family hydrolase [Saccharothrix espanaensis DSM 44229]